MSWRVIDITEDGRFIRTERQSLVLQQSGQQSAQQTGQKGWQEIGRVPLSDVHSVLVHARYASYSHDVFIKLAEWEIPLILCDARHNPVSTLMPLEGHHVQAKRMRDQALTSRPVQKRLWQQIIKAKVTEQARTLALISTDHKTALLKMVQMVKSGDPENIEAQAARYYWSRLFGSDFSRDRQAGGLNAHLNYGYTILRSAVARAVVASGLNPALGVGHINQRNNFALVDDLIEPFRPLVDRCVYVNRDNWGDQLTAPAKATLAGLLQGTLILNGEETDLINVLARLTNSLVQVYAGEQTRLDFPAQIVISGQFSLEL